jgi:hypothetical protein
VAKLILVSGSDAAYFPLLKDWLTCIKSLPELAHYDIGILNIGLTAEQVEWLRGQGAQVVVPDWEFNFPDRDRMPPVLRAMAAKPVLPKYFPGHEIIVWLDADIWIQEPRYALLYCIGAEGHGLTVTPELDRTYPTLYGGKHPVLLQHHSAYYQCFGRHVADFLIGYPIINSGAFGIHRDHPIWKRWAQRLSETYTNAVLFHAEQAALNHAVYHELEAMRPHLLPSLANWICAVSLPMWSRELRKLVEPALPHDPIGVIHLTSVRKATIRTIDNTNIEVLLTYSGIKSMRGTDPSSLSLGRSFSYQVSSNVGNRTADPPSF